MVEQSMTWQLNGSCDLQYSTLTLTRLDRWSDKSNLINWLVKSSPSMYMIVSTKFCKLLLRPINTQPFFYLKSARKQRLSQLCCEKKRLSILGMTLNCICISNPEVWEMWSTSSLPLLSGPL